MPVRPKPARPVRTKESAAPRSAVIDDQLAKSLGAGLSKDMLGTALRETYRIVDMLDETLVKEGYDPLAKLVELANLSSMLGNLLATSIVRHSGGLFTRAGAHKYQDLRANSAGAFDVEIKVALENNKPKGHLPKAGHYLTFRYILGDKYGNFDRSRRGNVVWFWEVRFGELDLGHFSISNTVGDSGKTAVVTTDGMKQLRRVFLEPTFCPYANVDRYINVYG